MGALLAIAGALLAGVFAVAAGAHRGDACSAAKAKVAATQHLIAVLQKQLANVTSVAGVVNPTRKAQIDTQLARDRAQLVKDQAAQAAACGSDLASFDGTYSGNVPGTNIKLTFTVQKGVVNGDLSNRPPLANLDAKTGNVSVVSTFPGLSCGTFTLHFDGKGTATARQVTCTFAGQTGTDNFVAFRQ